MNHHIIFYSIPGTNEATFNSSFYPLPLPLEMRSFSEEMIDFVLYFPKRDAQRTCTACVSRGIGGI